MPRLAPEGRGFEQEIILLRSMINRLLSRRPLNHTYISRYMRLLIQAIAAQSKAPKQTTDEQEVDSLIKKLFYKRVEDGQLSFYDLLPVRTSQPGEKWWPWRQLMTVGERRRDGLIGPEDRWPSDVDEYLDKKAAHEAEMAAYKAETWRDMEAVLEGMFANDPVLSNLYDPDLEPSDDDDSDPDDDPNPPHNDTPDDDQHPPDLTVTPNPPPEPSVIPDLDDEHPPDLSVIPAPEPVEDVEDAPRRAPRRESIPRGGAGGPTPSPLRGEGWGEGDPLPDGGAAHPEPLEARVGGGPRPAHPPPPSPEPPFTPIQAGAPNYWETDSFSSPIDPTGPSPDWPDPNPHPKPRIARGRPLPDPDNPRPKTE